MRTRRYRKRGGACPDGPDCQTSPSILNDPLAVLTKAAGDMKDGFEKTTSDLTATARNTTFTGALNGFTEAATSSAKAVEDKVTEGENAARGQIAKLTGSGGRRRKSKRRRTKRR